MIFCVAFVAPCRFFLCATVQLENHTLRQYDRMLSIEQFLGDVVPPENS